MAQDGETLLFVPVMDDVREQVGIAPRGNRLEEVAGLNGDALLDAALIEQGGRVAYHMRHVEEHAARPGMAGQDRRQHVAGGAAHIHYRTEV